MTKQHFIAFAEKARQLRLDAKTHEKAGNKELADCATYQALGIEQAVIEVAQKFNPRFDDARFRAACNPDNALAA